MPRTFGDGILHISEINFMITIDIPIYSHEVEPFTAEEDKIGNYIASLIEDRSTLQMGIGSIPNAALSKLTNHKDLGLHTEMFSEGLVDLVEKGIVNGSQKKTNPYKIVSGFAMGTRRLYDFMDNNP